MVGRRFFLVGLAVALVASLVALAVASPRSDPAQDFSVTVPTGRLGDDVAYAAFERNSSDDPWAPAGGWSFLVEGTDQSVDITGMEHGVLQVLTASDSIDVSTSPAPEVDTTRVEFGQSERVFLDLSTGHALRLDFDYRFAEYAMDPSVRLETAQGRGIIYGPFFTGDWPPHYDMIGSVPAAFEHQGKTYRLGESLDTSQTHLLDAEWVLFQEGVSVLSMARGVDARGTVGGLDALRIRTEGCIELDLSDRSPGVAVYWGLFRIGYGSGPGTASFLHDVVPSTSEVCFVADVWVSSESAYPLLYEERVVVNGTESHEWLEALSGDVSGAETIPWGQDDATEHYRSSQPGIERSPAGSTYPADGSATWLDFPLSEALQAVQSDPTLSGFRAWQIQFPDNRLVGATLDRVHWPCAAATRWQPEPTSSSWMLTYGVPEGEFFVVFTARPGETDPALSCEYGTLSGPEFRLEDMPTGPITLGAIGERWEETGVGARSAPHWFDWGAGWYCDPYEFPNKLPRKPPWTCDPESEPRVFMAGPFQWGRAFLGYYLSSEAGQPTAEWGFYIDVGMTTGNLLDAWDYFGHDVPAVFLGPQDLEGPPARVAEVPAAPPPVVELVAAAAVAGGMLAALAAAYLYPILKFYGAQALLLVPGYAKIKKDELLDNAIRDQVYQLVRADPGISPPEVARQIAAGWTTIVYHLRVLETNRLVSSLLDGRHKRFFPADSVDWSRRGQLAALRNEKTKAIYGMLQGEPGLVRGEVARRMGFSTTSADWHLDRLRAAGLVGLDRDGRKVHFYPNPVGLPPSPLDSPHGVEVA